MQQGIEQGITKGNTMQGELETRVRIAHGVADEALEAADHCGQVTLESLLCSLGRIRGILSGNAYYDYEAQKWVGA